MGQCLKGTYGVFLRKRKLSQTFSIRLFALRAKIAHYVGVVTSSHLLWSDSQKGNVAKKSRQPQNGKRECEYCPFTIV